MRRRPAEACLWQVIRHAGQEDLRLEDKQALEIKRALVVEQPAPTRNHELRHDDGDCELWIHRQLPKVLKERIAEVAIGRFDDVEREVELGAAPVALDRLRLRLVECEEHCTAVWQIELSGVVDGPQRGSLDAGDEHTTDN